MFETVLPFLFLRILLYVHFFSFFSNIFYDFFSRVLWNWNTFLSLNLPQAYHLIRLIGGFSIGSHSDPTWASGSVFELDQELDPAMFEIQHRAWNLQKNTSFIWQKVNNQRKLIVNIINVLLLTLYDNAPVFLVEWSGFVSKELE